MSARLFSSSCSDQCTIFNELKHILSGQTKINAYFSVLFFRALQIAAQPIDDRLLYFLALCDIELMFMLGILQGFASCRGVGQTLL